MIVIMNFYPIAIGRETKTEKKQVLGLVLEDNFDRLENGLIESPSIMAPSAVDFWTSKEIAETFISETPVQVQADISVNKANNLSVRVRKIFYNGKFIEVSSKLDENPFDEE